MASKSCRAAAPAQDGTAASTAATTAAASAPAPSKALMAPALLERVMQKGDLKGMLRLISAGMDPNSWVPVMGSPLTLASGLGDVAIIKGLLERGADINLPDQHPKLTRRKILLTMDEEGFSWDFAELGGRGTALMQASFKGHVQAVYALIAAGAQVNAQDSQGRTALVYAVRGGSVQVVSALLDGGADPNIAAADGLTPMHIAAAERGDLRALQRMLAKGGNASVATANGGCTLLMAAAAAGHASIVAALVKVCDVNARDADGCTALMAASTAGTSPSVAHLLKAGAQPNAVDRRGCSALHYAAAAAQQDAPGRMNVWRELLRAGCDCELRNVNGFTALEEARGDPWLHDLQGLVVDLGSRNRGRGTGPVPAAAPTAAAPAADLSTAPQQSPQRQRPVVFSWTHLSAPCFLARAPAPACGAPGALGWGQHAATPVFLNLWIGECNSKVRKQRRTHGWHLLHLVLSESRPLRTVRWKVMVHSLGRGLGRIRMGLLGGGDQSLCIHKGRSATAGRATAASAAAARPLTAWKRTFILMRALVVPRRWRGLSQVAAEKRRRGQWFRVHPAWRCGRRAVPARLRKVRRRQARQAVVGLPAGQGAELSPIAAGVSAPEVEARGQQGSPMPAAQQVQEEGQRLQAAQQQQDRQSKQPQQKQELRHQQQRQQQVQQTQPQHEQKLPRQEQAQEQQTQQQQQQQERPQEQQQQERHASQHVSQQAASGGHSVVLQAAQQAMARRGTWQEGATAHAGAAAAALPSAAIPTALSPSILRPTIITPVIRSPPMPHPAFTPSSSAPTPGVHSLAGAPATASHVSMLPSSIMYAPYAPPLGLALPGLPPHFYGSSTVLPSTGASAAAIPTAPLHPASPGNPSSSTAAQAPPRPGPGLAAPLPTTSLHAAALAQAPAAHTGLYLSLGTAVPGQPPYTAAPGAAAAGSMHSSARMQPPSGAAAAAQGAALKSGGAQAAQASGENLARKVGRRDARWEEEHACVCCLEREREVVLQPCGHAVLCASCCADIRAAKNECPMCRERILLTTVRNNLR